MKRLLTVALGVALCTIATAAKRRPTTFRPARTPPSFPTAATTTIPGPAALGARQRAGIAGARQHPLRPPVCNAPLEPPGHRSGRRRVPCAAGAATPMAARSFTRYASPGTSRGCLTSSARALLGRIESQFGAVQIISTCRPGARIAGTGRISRHASGNAVDFNAGGRKAAIVRWLIANHKSGGTMTYAGMSHIHVDIGYRFVSLGSGGGRYRYRQARRHACSKGAHRAPFFCCSLTTAPAATGLARDRPQPRSSSRAGSTGESRRWSCAAARAQPATCRQTTARSRPHRPTTGC